LKRSLHLISLALFTAACSGVLGETPADLPRTTGAAGSTAEVTTSTVSPAGCVRFTGDHSVDIDTGSLAADALTLSGETFLCADDVVVVGTADLNEVAAAAQLAAAVSGPLLFPEPRLAAELGRLKPSRVHVVGNAQVNVPGGAETVPHDSASAIDLASSLLGSPAEVLLPALPDSSTIVETVAAISSEESVARPGSAATGSTTVTTAPPALDTGALVRGIAAIEPATSLWVVEASNPETILLASAVGHSIGASVLAIDGEDVLGYPEVGEVLQGHSPDAIRHVGGVPSGSDWELAVLANGQELPGGGYYVLPKDHLRRYVSYYGNPQTVALGALGEQGPAETLDVMQPLLQAYAGDGAQVVPAFEIIASVASAGPTDDGDYSYEWPPDTFSEWIDFAGKNGVYVVLDLQPGRDDFLSQAVQYEELLRLPYVGLAIDPEWRLKDNQVHLKQVGTVDSSEINQTINWLADLVRDNGLPQKMVVVHQFRTSMVTNRADLVDRPEIQLIVQMDGDGLEAQKDDTWAALLEGAEDAHWAWGWKNFYDEDEPGPPSPESTMSKVPTPVYVSYQ
jgi:hypothetical protein